MAAPMSMRILSKVTNLKACQNLMVPCRHSNTLFNATLEKHRRSKLSKDQEKPEPPPEETAPRNFQYVYPEFLPPPDWRRKDRIKDKLERMDMLRRRSVITIPEFYVGSILAVTVSDPYAPGKTNRFVGICIDRQGYGLNAAFTLRNVIDGQGVEIMYHLYNPTMHKFEVLKLERRMDDTLYYLRDAPLEYSTVPFNMAPVILPPGAAVPVNKTVVPLNPPPWHERWERRELQGATMYINEVRRRKAELRAKPWEKYDIVSQYRNSNNPEETKEVMDEVFTEFKKLERKKRGKKFEDS